MENKELLPKQIGDFCRTKLVAKTSFYDSQDKENCMEFEHIKIEEPVHEIRCVVEVDSYILEGTEVPFLGELFFIFNN